MVNDTHTRRRRSTGWIFNDLKVILGVFHDAESIYDTFKAITGRPILHILQ